MTGVCIYSNPMRTASLTPFYRCWEWVLTKISNMAVVTGLLGGWARYRHGFHLTLLLWSFYWFIRSTPRYQGPASYQDWSKNGWMFGGDESVLEMRKFSVSFVNERMLSLYCGFPRRVTLWNASLLTTLKPGSHQEQPWSLWLPVS